MNNIFDAVEPGDVADDETVVLISFNEAFILNTVGRQLGPTPEFERLVNETLGIDDLPEHPRMACTGDFDSPARRLMTKEEYGRFYAVEIAPYLD